MSRWYFWLPFSAVALSSSMAHATPDFPGAIIATLNLSGGTDQSKMCVLCHQTSEGRAKTITQPFGRKVQGYGLAAFDVPTLNGILVKMRDARDDSDKDGISDIDEIKAGTDPNINNDTGEPPEDYPPPVYGCHTSGARAGTPRAGGWAAIAAGMMGLLALRARTSPRRVARARRKGRVK